MKEKITRFVKQEAVLCAALILASVSMLLVPPDGEYISYIDFRTLAVLFCLMGVMSGLQKTGLFQLVAETLLTRVRRAWQLVLILDQICIFTSKLITNDEALITFVPFTLTVLGLAGPEIRTRLLVPTVVLQTIAANLGSMLTPVGNPQNLYLYGKAGTTLPQFILLMLPYTIASLLLLSAWSLIQSRAHKAPVEVSFAERTAPSGKPLCLGVYALLLYRPADRS